MSFKKTFMFVSALVITIGAMAVTDGGDGTPITIYETETPQHSVPPKAPVIIPIECLVYSSSSSIEVIFDYYLGTVSVEIENKTTGEYNQTVVNALSGSTLLPFSGISGIWTITFTLSDGTVYYGEFNL